MSAAEEEVFVADDVLEVVLSDDMVDGGQQHQDVGVQVPAITTTTTPTTTTAPSVRAKKPKTLACLLCGKMYGSNSFLQRHLLSVHRLCRPVQNFKCDYCNAAMTDRNEYELHMLAVEARLRAFLGPVQDDASAEVGRKRSHNRDETASSSDQSMEDVQQGEVAAAALAQGEEEEEPANKMPRMNE